MITNGTQTGLILMVDDSKLLQMCFSRLLQKIKFIGEIHLANDGQEAVEKFRESILLRKHYDIIFMDLEMPGKDGAEATKEIREIEEALGLPETPILCTSSLEEAQKIAIIRERRMSGSVDKPFIPEQINGFLRKHSH